MKCSSRLQATARSSRIDATTSSNLEEVEEYLGSIKDQGALVSKDKVVKYRPQVVSSSVRVVTRTRIISRSSRGQGSSLVSVLKSSSRGDSRKTRLQVKPRSKALSIRESSPPRKSLRLFKLKLSSANLVRHPELTLRRFRWRSQ